MKKICLFTIFFLFVLGIFLSLGTTIVYAEIQPSDVEQHESHLLEIKETLPSLSNA